jgi:multidrug efflux pump subunit AcrB
MIHHVQTQTQNGEVSIKLELTLNLNINAETGIISCNTDVQQKIQDVQQREVDFIIPEFAPTKELLDFENK